MTKRKEFVVVDHLVLFAVKEGATSEEVGDLLSSIRALADDVPGVEDLSVGEDFSGRTGEYTHGLYVRFADRSALETYMKHPAHLEVVEKLGSSTTGRLVADYEH